MSRKNALILKRKNPRASRQPARLQGADGGPASRRGTMAEREPEGGSAPTRREQLADTLKLPKDMLLGASILTVTGSHEVWVENYRGIMEYTQESIVLQTKTGRISICGCGLVIDYYTNEDMKIIGNIQCISYL